RVSRSVMRRPFTKSLSLPSCLRVRVSVDPPPCTTATRCPSRESSTEARAHFSSVASSSSARPPILITIVNQPLLFPPSVNQVHVLDRLPGSPFEQVVFAGNDDQPLSVRGQAEPEIAIIGVHRELDFGKLRGAKHPHEAAPGVEVAVTG